MKTVIASDHRERSNPANQTLDRCGRLRGLAMTILIAAPILTACNQQSAMTMRGPVPGDNSAQAAQEIMAADRAFNEEAKAKGTGQAFADYMDPAEGLLVQPGGEPIKGRDAIFAAQNDNTVPSPLVWEPAAAFASKSGDFGASWGHWTLTGKRPDGTPVSASGKYVTVWRKDANGQWKGLMDTGVTDTRSPPAPSAAPAPTGPQSATASTTTTTSPANQEPPEVIQPPGPNQPSAHP